MSSSAKPLDVRKIKKLIKSGLQCLPIDKYHKEAIILIGDTGVGKSTLLSFFNKEEMIVRCDGFKVSLDTLGKSRSKIGHTKISETFVPTKIIIEKMAFYDCPGFKDNKGEQFQLANSFFLQRLFDNYKRIKIVIVVDESHISQVRAEKLPQLLKNLLFTFQKFDNICNGCCLIVSRADQQSTKQDYEQEILSTINNENSQYKLFGKESCKFLQFLTKNNRIFLFRQPKKSYTDYKYEPTVQDKSILTQIKNLPSIKSCHIRKNISDSSLLAIRQLIDSIISQSKNKIQILCSQMSNQFLNESLQIQKDSIKLLDLKNKVLKLIQQINSCSTTLQILELVTTSIHALHSKQLQEDFTIVQFFKDLRNRETDYFRSLKQSLNQQILKAVHKLQTKISVSLQQKQIIHSTMASNIVTSIQSQDIIRQDLKNKTQKAAAEQIQSYKHKVLSFEQQYPLRINQGQKKKLEDLKKHQELQNSILEQRLRKQKELEQKIEKEKDINSKHLQKKQKSQQEILRNKISKLQQQEEAKLRSFLKNKQLTEKIKQRNRQYFIIPNKNSESNYSTYVSKQKNFDNRHQYGQSQQSQTKSEEKNNLVKNYTDYNMINIEAEKNGHQLKQKGLNDEQSRIERKLRKQQKIQEVIREIKKRRQERQQRQQRQQSQQRYSRQQKQYQQSRQRKEIKQTQNQQQNFEKIVQKPQIIQKYDDIKEEGNKKNQKALQKEIKYDKTQKREIEEKKPAKIKQSKEQKLLQTLQKSDKSSISKDQTNRKNQEEQLRIKEIIRKNKEQIERRRRIQKWQEEEKRRQKLQEIQMKFERSQSKSKIQLSNIPDKDRWAQNNVDKQKNAIVNIELQFNDTFSNKRLNLTERHMLNDRKEVYQKSENLSKILQSLTQTNANKLEKGCAGQLSKQELPKYLDKISNNSLESHEYPSFKSSTSSFNSKQLRSSTSLISQIKQVLKSLKVVSGDLEKVKSEAISLSLKTKGIHGNHFF